MEDDERTARIEEVVQPVLREHGLTLVDLEWRSHRPRGVLRLFVDRPGGVAVGDCERLSRELGDVFEAAALVEGAYDLEVSSPGLDRQLRKERELVWARGRPVRCWLAGGQEVGGRLKEVLAERLVIERDGGVAEVERAQVTKIRLEPEVPWSRRAWTG
ncbi:MAG TPA: ribosome maturation factor RimP [Vicinamibacteria bacterium]|nr:ribosome maturation factor RimP [Vicinamibacteria bacterium]